MGTSFTKVTLCHLIKRERSGGEGKGELSIPAWDPMYHGIMSEREKELSENAFRDFWENPQKYAAYYLNPSGAPAEYYYLEIFAQYSELHTSADNLIWAKIADIYGLAAAQALYNSKLHNQFADTSNDRSENIIITATAITIYSIPTLGEPGIQEFARILSNQTKADAIRMFNAFTVDANEFISQPNGAIVAKFSDGSKITYYPRASIKSAGAPSIEVWHKEIGHWKVKFYPGGYSEK